MTYGLTAEGFNRKTLPVIKSDLEESLTAQYGEINSQPQSFFGQLVGVESKEDTDIWENLEALYFSQYPNSAEGVSLDYVVALNGITRIPAQPTIVIGVCGGTESTLINEGALALQPTTNESFSAVEDGLITRNNAVDITVSTDTLSNTSYNINVNGNSYFASLPRIIFDDLFVIANSITASINSSSLTPVPFNADSQTTIDDLATALQGLTAISTATAKLGLVINFDIDFVSLNSILATLNGVGLTPVIFSSDQATTIALLATEIQNHASVTTCMVTGSKQITIVPVDVGTFQVDSILTTLGATQPLAIDQVIDIIPALGETVVVDFVTTSGGASQANATDVFRTASTILSIVAQLVSVINAGVDPITAIDNLDDTFQILANSTSVGYSLSVASQFTIQTLFSPVTFQSVNFGVIPAPVGTLTEITTFISGWDSITNTEAGTTGREIETDAELRLRRQNSIRIIGAATVEAIRARILQEVLGVTQAFVFENRTMTEVDIVIVLSIDLVTGNNVTVTVNTIPLTTIPFTSTHLNTMQLIAVEMETVEGISNVIVGGVGNRTLTVEMNQGFEITVNDFVISGGATIPTRTISGGRFPKSFEAVVSGGTDEDIGNKIWQTKPAGIQTFGTSAYGVIDSQGDTQVMNFSRPTSLYVWISVDLTLTSEEEFPSNGVDLVKQFILDYGNTLGIGEDVFKQRVNCQIFEVSGIASGVMIMTFELTASDSPTAFSSNDIPVNNTQLAIFDLDRIIVEVV